MIFGRDFIIDFAKYRINTTRYHLIKTEYPSWLIEKYTEAAWKITESFIKQHKQELKDSSTDVIQLRNQLSTKFKLLYIRVQQLNNIANKVLESSLKQIEF